MSAPTEESTTSDSQHDFASVWVKAELCDPEEEDELYDEEENEMQYSEYESNREESDGSETSDDQPVMEVKAARTCQFCGFIENNLRLYLKHLQTHSKLTDVTCNMSECGQQFASVAAYIDHLREAHKLLERGNRSSEKTEVTKVKVYTCDHCPYKTKYKSGLKKHKEGKHTDIEYNCDQCEHKSKYYQSLQRHKKLKHDPERLKKCIFCKFKFSTEFEYLAHVSQFHGDQLKLASQGNLASGAEGSCSTENGNVVKTEGPQSLESQKIGSVVDFEMLAKLNESLVNSLRMQLNAKIREQAKKRRRLDDKRPKRFSCDQCDFTTKYSNSYKLHLFKHNPEKNYKCTNCNYDTKYPSALRRHLKMHLQPGSSEYTCDQCDYKTVYQENLKLHYRKHSLEKRFKCDKCSYETAYNNCFMKHKKVHTKVDSEKNFQCEKCPFNTKVEGRMNLHLMRTHKQDIDLGFKCTHCDFSTKLKWRMNIHEKKSLKNYTIKCHHCDYQTVFKCAMRFHRSKHMYNYNFDLDVKHYQNDEAISNVISPEVIMQTPDTPVTVENRSEIKPESSQLYPQNYALITKPEMMQQNIYPSYPIPENSSQSENIDLNSLSGDKKSQDYIENSTGEALSWNEIPVLEFKGTDKPFSCYSCEYKAKFKASVQRHYQRHHNKRSNQYKCVRCDFATSTKDSIHLHVRRSKVNYELNCKCGSFKTVYKCQLVQHEKIHNMFRCTICTYSCKSKYDLERHYAAHNGLGLKCRFCDYVTIRKDTLIRHEWVHTGHKPFKCDFCEFSAFKSCTLECHVKKFHGNLFSVSREGGSESGVAEGLISLGQQSSNNSSNVS